MNSKLLSFTFIVGDENDNGKVDVTASLSVAGFSLFSKTVDVDPAEAFRLVSAATKAVGGLVDKVRGVK